MSRYRVTLSLQYTSTLSYKAHSHCAFFLIATVLPLIATNGLYRTQWKCYHYATVTTSPTPIVSKNKSQLQIAQYEWALTKLKILLLRSRWILSQIQSHSFVLSFNFSSLEYPLPLPNSITKFSFQVKIRISTPTVADPGFYVTVVDPLGAPTPIFCRFFPPKKSKKKTKKTHEMNKKTSSRSVTAYVSLNNSFHVL